MIFYIIGAVVLFIAVSLTMVMLTDRGITHWRYLRRVRLAEKRLDTNPTQVRQVCTKVCQKLDRFAQRGAPKVDGLAGLPDGSKALGAYAHAQSGGYPKRAW